MKPGRSSQNHIPIILGPPFLDTADATISCKTGVMDVSVMNMRVRLNIFKTSSQPSIEDNSYCYLLILRKNARRSSNQPPFTKLNIVAEAENCKKQLNTAAEAERASFEVYRFDKYRVKIIEEIQRSQGASFQNMESQIKLLATMIAEKLLSNIPSNTVTLRDVKEQVITFQMFMDDEDETTQEPEVSTSPRFQETLLNTSVVEESKKVECLPENKNEYEEGELEKENESRVERIMEVTQGE
ncbi:hypothetical protein M9H77_02289 [Catharanthus roseus]|uniref:Uncharacterized protein n=1 Tax=Catharanthus roseus TaxID=4058 RepID=A0ACC0C866_CATRO|nr:hypothetical protein M9H77_02289 [Catharanthus roseus]